MDTYEKAACAVIFLCLGASIFMYIPMASCYSILHRASPCTCGPAFNVTHNRTFGGYSASAYCYVQATSLDVEKCQVRNGSLVHLMAPTVGAGAHAGGMRRSHLDHWMDKVANPPNGSLGFLIDPSETSVGFVDKPPAWTYMLTRTLIFAPALAISVFVLVMGVFGILCYVWKCFSCFLSCFLCCLRGHPDDEREPLLPHHHGQIQGGVVPAAAA